MSCSLLHCHNNTVWQFRNCTLSDCPMKTDEALGIETSSPEPKPELVIPLSQSTPPEPNRPSRTTYYYLACPYTHEDHNIRTLRYTAALQCHIRFVSLGVSIFNPIAMAHNASELTGREVTHEMWLRFDHPFLIGCAGMFVLELPGWAESKGIAWEAEVMIDLNKPIFFIPPDEYITDWPKDVLRSFYGDVIMNTEKTKEE